MDRRISPALAGAMLLFVAPAWAEDFYKGKQINMIVASGVGGGYDVYARAFARHASKYIPGNPVFVARNMPGAGGLHAANTLANTAPKDGTTIAALTNGVAMDPLFGVAAAKYDGRKLSWIGSIGKLQNICATWHTSPVKDIEAATKREIVVAAAGATSNSAVMPRIANDLLGTKFKIITGYNPNAGLNQAMEGGEAEGICGLSWSTLKASRPHWITNKWLQPLVQFGMEKLADLPDVPSALDLVKDPDKRRILNIVLVRQEVGRPLAAPPGVPAAQLAILRSAFGATMKDPAYLAEAKKLGQDVEPLTGAQIDAFMADVYATPKPIVDRATKLIVPVQKKKK
ncbi:MAG: Bug family tripartite tricarboxylate transporter substrate binding protein [Beijerinckiaceae bacterium]